MNSNKLKDEFVRENKKNGLIEKFYNYCKNKTDFGIGSKKVEQKIGEVENGKVSLEEAKNKLSDYKLSQENAAQNFGDYASALAAVLAYFKLSNMTNEFKARYKTKSMHPLMQDLMEVIPKRFNSKIENFVNSKYKSKAMILPLLMLVGGITKLNILTYNRFGSKEFKIENKKQLDKNQLKKIKKDLNHKKHALDFKNFYTGAFNGLLAPITAIAGGLAGVPAYILATSGIRFLTSKRDKKDKSFKNYMESLKNNAVLNSLFVIALAVTAFKKAQYSKVLGENLNKVVSKLKDIKLQKPDLPSTTTAFGELEDIMLNSKKIKNILSDTVSEIDEQVCKLTEENIFAVKFLQISNRWASNNDKKISSDRLKEISSALIENCPPSRTIEEAQKEINKLLNSDKYKVSKLLGVGTVAESYLAKDESGKEVCIKILKNGINSEKIQRDKEAFINLVTNGTSKRRN